MLFTSRLFGGGFVQTANDGFTQKDRELLITLKAKVDEIDKRFEFIQNLLIAMLAVFGGLCGTFVGLLLWDRKTFKEKAKEEAVREIEERSKITKALKQYAGNTLIGPGSIPWEVGNAFSAMLKQGRLTLNDAHKGHAIFQGIPNFEWQSSPCDMSFLKGEKGTGYFLRS